MKIEKETLHRLKNLIGSLELTGLVIAYVAFGFLLPWWSLVIPAGVAGFMAYARERIIWSIALIAALSWIAVAGVHDFATAGRISARIGMVIGLPNGVFVYLLIGFIAATLAVLAAMAGSTLRGALEILRHSQEFRGGRPKG